ncbi:hypothetical protein IWZ00DRAFT_501711 [Phyllosticta capitalensis]|uniref:Uncharacterized protein n=1 Tax=Phyllosticta capitalensis TaxID=121624 RepID=A0ABR1YUF0_9PEZI
MLYFLSVSLFSTLLLCAPIYSSSSPPTSSSPLPLTPVKRKDSCIAWHHHSMHARAPLHQDRVFGAGAQLWRFAKATASIGCDTRPALGRCGDMGLEEGMPGPVGWLADNCWLARRGVGWAKASIWVCGQPTALCRAVDGLGVVRRTAPTVHEGEEEQQVVSHSDQA